MAIETAFSIDTNHQVTGLPDDIAAARERFDHEYGRTPETREKFFEGLYDSLHQSQGAIPHVHFRQPGDSTRAVMIGQPPFGTAVVPNNSRQEVTDWLGLDQARRGDVAKKLRVNSNAFNMLIKTGLLDYFNRQLGVVDEAGDPMSIMLASGPDTHYRPDFSRAENQAIKSGLLAPYANRLLDTAARAGYQNLLPYGYSRGSAVGAEMLTMGPKQGFNVVGGVLVEPPNHTKLPFVRKFAPAYAADFAQGTKPEAKTGSWIDDGPQPRLDIVPGSDEAWQANLYKNGNAGHNLRAARGMAAGGRFLPNVKKALGADVPIVVGFGEASGLAARVGDIILADEELAAFAEEGLLRVIRAGGMAPHSFGENHVAYAAMFHQGFRAVGDARR